MRRDILSFVIDNCVLVQGYECLSACLGYYFSADYPEITGSDICIYGGALNVSYQPETHVLATPMYDSNYVFLDENKIAYTHDYLNPKDAETFVSKCVNGKRRLILKVCSELLSYNRVFKQAEHSTHFINIVGETQNQYRVVDCYVPTREPSVFDGYVDKEEIISAWQGKNFEYIVLDEIRLESGKVCEKVNKSIVNFIQGYCGLSPALDVETGEQAVMRLLRYIEERMETPEFRNITLEINYELKIYGFLSSKIMLTKVLGRVPVYAELCGAYEAVILNWSNICMHLVKLGITRKREQFEKLLESVTRVMKAERDILLDILAQLQGV